jgi:hypothetical protein
MAKYKNMKDKMNPWWYASIGCGFVIFMGSLVSINTDMADKYHLNGLFKVTTVLGFLGTLWLIRKTSKTSTGRPG